MYLYICICIYSLRAVRCTIMKDWVGALSTIPREHLRVNNLVFVYMYFVYMYLYICICIYRLRAVRCTIMQDWGALTNVNDWVGALSTIPIEHLRVIDVGWVSQRACMQFEGI